MSLLGSAPASDLSKNILVCNRLVARKSLTATEIQADDIVTESLVAGSMSTETLVVSGMAVEGELTVGGLPVAGSIVVEAGLSGPVAVVINTGVPSQVIPFDTVLNGDASLLDAGTGELIVPEDGVYNISVSVLNNYSLLVMAPAYSLSTNLALSTAPPALLRMSYTHASKNGGVANAAILSTGELNGYLTLSAGDRVSVLIQVVVTPLGAAGGGETSTLRETFPPPAVTTSVRMQKVV